MGERRVRMAFFDTKSYTREFFDRANERHGFEIKYYKERLSPDTAPLTKGFDAVCIFVNDQVTAEVADELVHSGVKFIALRCAGYNNVDLKAVYGRIHVARVPAYSPHAVAEHAVALMLSLNRKIHKAYYRTHDNNFAIEGLMGFDMYGKTAGVIGTGRIGKVVIEILRGFGMRVLAHDPYPDEAFAAKTGCEYVDLDTLYGASDIITLHCPLTPKNVHMINAGSIAQMKDGVMIINTGRGKLIDTADLIEGLKSKKIGAAGLDVYEEEEEYFFEDWSSDVVGDDVLARLLTFPNVLITSHQAFFTREAFDNIADTTLNNIAGFFREESLENEICYKCSDTSCPRETTGKCW
ncbi:MAG: 2-hydroxyacid dehydrogenase [Kiritimatiellae bacterium]|nr:2-hydroxyacid dehydrogenase [Kiritimatiellia bacterium]